MIKILKNWKIIKNLIHLYNHFDNNEISFNDYIDEISAFPTQYIFFK